MDIQQKINDYINNGGQYTREEIENAIRNIAPEHYEGANVSVFNIDSGSISQSDFRTAMSQIAGSDVSADADIIFDLFNSDDDDKLTLQELGSLANLNRQGHFQIESFSAFNTFVSFIRSDGTTSSSSTDDTTDTPTTSTSTSSTNDTSNDISWQFSDEVNEKRKLIEETIGDGSGLYKSPEDVISYLLSSGTIDDKMADALRASYTTYSKEDETSIASHLKLMRESNPDATRADAIAELEAAGAISAPITDASTPLSETKVNNQVNVDVDKYVELLHDAMDGLGTDEDMLENILINSLDKLSDADFVAIVSAYENKYGMGAGKKGLVTQIESDTSGDLQARLTRALGLRLASAANNGVNGAAEILAYEAYSGTAGQNCTANDFLEAIFADPASGGLSDEAVAKLSKAYKSIFGHKLQDDIKGDYGGFLNWRNWLPGKHNASGEGQAMIDRLNLCD